MPTNGEDALIEALRAAIAAAPGNVAVRVQLGEALLSAGEPEEALLHARAVLASEPDRSDALHLAARAAERVGDDEVSGSYARLRAALDGPEELVEEFDEDEAYAETPVATEPLVTLADIGGMAEVKQALERSFLGPLRHPELRKAYGADLGGGLLLYGPPGCGKTMLARAVAGEMGAQFVSLGLEDVLDSYLGQSERRLHEAFAHARRAGPSVLFLDEIDALGHKRGNLRGSAGRNIVNQLLAEMDGIDSGDDGVFVLAATNHPWDVDAALRRPGRFDRSLLVLPPNHEARAAIVDLHLRERPTKGVDSDRIAALTEGLSGADLALVCRTAAAAVMAEAMASGAPRPITQADLMAAVKEVPASTRPWFQLAYNYAAFSGEAHLYDDLLAYIRRHKLA